MKKLEVGTLINDNDKIGVVTKVIEVGTLDVEVDIIKWRANYEIHYVDGIISVLGCATVERLIDEGKIEIVYRPTTPLPPSSSKDIMLDVIHMQKKKIHPDKDTKRREKFVPRKQKKDQ